MEIEDTITIPGYAWIDNEGDINWSTREDMETITKSQRPEGCTPVIIEINPTQQWVDKKNEMHQYLQTLDNKAQKINEEIEQLSKTLKAGGYS